MERAPWACGKPGIPPEHFGRIRALARRFAQQWEEPEYQSLRPVADLIRHVAERVLAFTTNPSAWEPSTATDAEKDAVVALISQDLYVRLHRLVAERLVRERAADWQAAYLFSGRGSSRRRAQSMRGIYETAAPIPFEVPNADGDALLAAFRDAFVGAAETVGARVLGDQRVEAALARHV